MGANFHSASYVLSSSTLFNRHVNGLLYRHRLFSRNIENEWKKWSDFLILLILKLFSLVGINFDLRCLVTAQTNSSRYKQGDNLPS